MNINRRQFSYLCFLSLFANHTQSGNKATEAKSKGAIYLSACKNNIGQHFMAAFDQNGKILYQHPLSYRGHSLSINYSLQQVYCFSRRPGNTIDIISFNGKRIYQVSALKNRHFYGHGAYDATQNYLYTTENNLDTTEGLISIRDINNTLSVKKELYSYGIGPHTVEISKDNQFLIIANGGVKTHPQTGRKKLNLIDMTSSLVFLHKSTGKLHRKITLGDELQFNSIRHIALGKDNEVFIALQNQWPNKKTEVLLAHYDYINDKTTPIRIPDILQNKLNHYLGDIVLDQSQQFFASSSPKGNTILFYDIANHRFLSDKLEDTCGIQSTDRPGEFIVSSGQGYILRYSIERKGINKKLLSYHPNIQWDNHIIKA